MTRNPVERILAKTNLVCSIKALPGPISRCVPQHKSNQCPISRFVERAPLSNQLATTPNSGSNQSPYFFQLVVQRMTISYVSTCARFACVESLIIKIIGIVVIFKSSMTAQQLTRGHQRRVNDDVQGVHRNPRLTISCLQKVKISFAEVGDNDAESVKSSFHLQDIATGHFSGKKNDTRFVQRYQRSMQTAKKVAIQYFGEPPRK